jgi:branched-subunit amino acid permease
MVPIAWNPIIISNSPMSQATKTMDVESIMNVHGPIMMIMFPACHVIIHLFEITNNKMLERLQQFDFGLAMHYIKGKENFIANALSKWPLANAISMVRNTIIKDIKK